ncbi:hypothetical protein [Kribbella deserti]|uniref:Uncharacterized protein n=1 Tax=Kribbella deserti TaxID=1926257 RepID=A0ABV6QNN9_9ACTN
MARANLDRQAAKKLGGAGDRLTAIINGIAETHADKPVEEIEAELIRQMGLVGVTGNWRNTAEAIAAGETVELRVP